MVIKLAFRINDGAEEVETRECGLLPIMVRVRMKYNTRREDHSTNGHVTVKPL